jgi:hypothetical protein
MMSNKITIFIYPIALILTNTWYVSGSWRG